MRTPDILITLVDHGIIDEVLRPLMSGKEAQIYLVSSGGEQRVAKIYKDAQNRSFQKRADYIEGRKVRNSRDQRAMNNRSRHGRAQNESAWKSAEVNMIYRLRDAGVRVPTPYHFIDGVLIMELVTDADGDPAARLGDLTFEPEEATQVFRQVLGEVVRMLCAGVVHGDLSDFNVLMGADGPVIIDFPQAVDASSNQNARKLLLRDVDNLHRFHAKFAPVVQPLPYAQEMWELYQRMALTPDTRLTGKFHVSRKATNTDDVLSLIADAEYEERRRREGLARAMRPGKREAAPLAHRVGGHVEAGPRGERAPASGHGQSEHRRPERSGTPAFTQHGRGHRQSDQRRPERSGTPAFTQHGRSQGQSDQRHPERSGTSAAQHVRGHRQSDQRHPERSGNPAITQQGRGQAEQRRPERSGTHQPGRGHGQAEQRRPERAGTATVTPHHRSTERPHLAERAGVRHAERPSSDTPRSQREAHAQQPRNDAWSNHRRDGRSSQETRASTSFRTEQTQRATEPESSSTCKRR